MLALKRNKKQQIVVDGPCVITVIGHDTRLGIEAEPHVKILRAELLEDATWVISPDESECEE